MKNIFKTTVLTLFILTLNSCDYNFGTKGSGKLVTEKREINPNITQIQVSNTMEVVLIQGNTPNLEVTADSNLLEFILTEQDGNTLTVKLKNNSNIQKYKSLKATITLPNISYISTSGASSLKTANTILSKEMELKASSSSDLKMNLETENLIADASSAAEMILQGKAMNIEYEASSSSTINAEKLFANYIKARASSAADIKCAPIVNLDAKASSSGTIHFVTKPKYIKKTESSAGSVSGN